MSEEENDTPEPRRNFITTALYSGPRNLLFTVVILFVLYNMFMNPASRRKEKDAASKAEIQKTQENPRQTPITQEVPTPTETKTSADNSALIAAKLEALEALEAKLDKAQATPTPVPDKAISDAALADISKTHEQLTALEKKIEEQQILIKNLSDELEQVKTLREKMHAIENSTSQKMASITLFSQLREATNRGESFKPLLDQLLELNKTNAQVNALLIQLLPVAPSGIYSIEKLKTQFDDALNQTLRRDNGNTFTSNLKKLIRIRKIGEQKGMDDESILARAETSIQQGNIQATLKNLEALSIDAKKIMSSWIRSAQEHINTQNTLSNLQTLLNQPTTSQQQESETEKPAPTESPTPAITPEEKTTPNTDKAE